MQGAWLAPRYLVSHRYCHGAVGTAATALGSPASHPAGKGEQACSWKRSPVPLPVIETDTGG